MKILILQHGDFGEAYRSFALGGLETYRDQKKSVDFVASYAPAHEVTTLAACGRDHREPLAPGLFSIGVARELFSRPAEFTRLLDDLAPDIVICRTPNLTALRWSAVREVPTLPIFADIFVPGGLRKRWRFFRLRRTLGAPVFACVANHSLNATLSLRDVLGLPARRIVPWDRSLLEIDPAPKPAPSADEPFGVFFAGKLGEAKGVGDCLKAAALLKEQGFAAEFAFAGNGELGAWQKRAEALGVADRAQFLGPLPNAEVRRRMREIGAVVVPSRREYAEGLPNTLCEGLASRTPVVVSDHPAFASRLTDTRDCLMFEAGNPASLADRIVTLSRDTGLYHRLSVASEAAYRSFFFGTEWTELVGLFLEDPSNERGWVQERSLDRLLERKAEA